MTVRVAPRLRTHSRDTCRVAALQHRGIVLQPSFLVGADLASGALVEVLPHYRSSEVGLHAVWPTRKHPAAKVRVRIDFLAEAFRTRSWPA